MNILFLVTLALVIITLISLAYRDFKDYILPDILNLNLFILLITLNYLSDWQLIDFANATAGAISGGFLLLSIKFLADKFYQKDSLGLGDVKLISAAGIGLGFPNIFIALSLGSFIGVIHGIIISKICKKELAQVQIPAGVGFSIAIIIILAIQVHNIYF